jgi:hypothetical protein
MRVSVFFCPIPDASLAVTKPGKNRSGFASIGQVFGCYLASIHSPTLATA